MAFSLTSDVEFLKKLPAYTPILKTVLKAQIELLVNQLSEHGGEESVFLTASMTDGTLSHIGSKSGQVFLESHEEFKSKFLHFCLGDTEPARNRDLQMQASKKMNKKQHKKHKRKHSDSFHSPGIKKLKTSEALSVAAESETVRNVSSEQTAKTSFPPRSVFSSEASQFQKETKEKDADSVGNEENCCLNTVSYAAADIHDKSTKDLLVDCEGNTTDKDENVDDCDQDDETDHAFNEENIIIKVEPGWDLENDGDTKNSEDTSYMEGASDVGLSYFENATAGPSTSSGNSAVFPDSIFTGDFVRLNKPRTKATRTSRSLATKYCVITAIESGEKTRPQVAREYKISQSTLFMWLKNAKQIKTDYLNNNLPPDRKRARKSQYEDIERNLLQWYRAAKENNFDITADDIMEKANQLARMLGYSPDKFSCTRGWIARFKLRYGLLNKKSARVKCGANNESDKSLGSVSHAVEQQNSKETELSDVMVALMKNDGDTES